MISKRYRILAWAAFIGMFFVLIAGAIVTQTDSGRGCGSDWPLCNGRFIPAYTLESMIEYSHRMITGVVGLLVIITFSFTWPFRKQYREAFVYASGTLVFTVIQALMGAAAVKWPQQPAVMALHFGISMLAVASSMLLVVWIYRFGKPNRSGVQTTTTAAIYAWFMWLFCYGVIYLGAFIRHMKVEGGCTGWPLCSGRLFPALSRGAEVVFAHRLAAAMLFVLIFTWAVMIWRLEARRETKRLAASSALLLLGVTCQILSGGWLTAAFGRANEFFFASLLHNTLATLLFSLLTDTAIRSWKYRRKGRESQLLGRYHGLGIEERK